MKKLIIILDPAHGIEVPGKRSPDSRHREYKWSRERLEQVKILLEAHGYIVVTTNPTDNEVGLSARVKVANGYAGQYPELIPLLVSLHNDAAGDGTEWKTATGISVWTSKGKTTSDIFADFFVQQFKSWFPKVRQRIYQDSYMDRDWESNFTVLMGNYFALLIECLFQDNRDDVILLEDPMFCKNVEDCIVDAIEDCEKYVTDNKLK